MMADVWCRKTEDKGLLGRHRCRWWNNIKMDLKERNWRGWTEIIWVRIGSSGGFVNKVVGLGVL